MRNHCPSYIDAIEIFLLVHPHNLTFLHCQKTKTKTTKKKQRSKRLLNTNKGSVGPSDIGLVPLGKVSSSSGWKYENLIKNGHSGFHTSIVGRYFLSITC